MPAMTTTTTPPNGGRPFRRAREDSVPEAEETKKIVFEYAYICSYLVPRIIIHSRKLNRFVAFRADFYEAKWKARSLSENREWSSISAIEQAFGRADLWPNLAIYMSDDLRDLFLVSDYHKVARPDIIVDFREKENWYQTEGSAPSSHYDVLQAPTGRFRSQPGSRAGSCCQRTGTPLRLLKLEQNPCRVAG